jgi:hypothetical protein
MKPSVAKIAAQGVLGDCRFMPVWVAGNTRPGLIRGGRPPGELNFALYYTERDRPKEMQRLLKFGRDSAWPLSVSVASTLDGSNSVTAPIQFQLLGLLKCSASSNSVTAWPL